MLVIYAREAPWGVCHWGMGIGMLLVCGKGVCAAAVRILDTGGGVSVCSVCVREKVWRGNYIHEVVCGGGVGWGVEGGKGVLLGVGRLGEGSEPTKEKKLGERTEEKEGVRPLATKLSTMQCA